MAVLRSRGQSERELLPAGVAAWVCKEGRLGGGMQGRTPWNREATPWNTRAEGEKGAGRWGVRPWSRGTRSSAMGDVGSPARAGARSGQGRAGAREARPRPGQQREQLAD
jgi:hypothetical protein